MRDERLFLICDRFSFDELVFLHLKNYNIIYFFSLTFKFMVLIVIKTRRREIFANLSNGKRGESEGHFDWDTIMSSGR